MSTQTDTGEKTPFYITTTLPYVNSKPHIGFAMEVVRADAIARYKRMLGFDVFFNTGTDEHGTKIFEKAQELGKEPQAYVDEMATHFQALGKQLNLSYDRFIRTTDADHVVAAQAFWKQCKDAGHIYKKEYTGLYCVGDEMFLKEKDLVNGRCPNHPTQDPVTLSEENYFFSLTNFSEQLLAYYESHPDFIVPPFRLNEMKQMIEHGLEDFSISRLKTKMPWGVPVPDDDEQVMYVWFDALVNYITAVGWPADPAMFEKYWVNGTPVQICGKDNTQHQALRWQAMLLAAGLPLSRHIIVNGFILADGGVKMSKSIGNVIDPFEIVEEYGTDALRYFVLRELSPFEDSVVTPEKIKEAYNAHLVNGVGNLTNRIMKLAQDYLDGPVDTTSAEKLFAPYTEAFDGYNVHAAMNGVWEGIQWIDEKIQREEPFKVVKVDLEKGKQMIAELVVHLAEVEYHLRPLLPETAEKIQAAIRANQKPEVPLFARKD
jgi:methionyl-tRNA synthetase